jgi:DNA-binding MarR family transcriptional regulator
MALPKNSSKDLLTPVIDTFWSTIPPVWNLIKTNVRGIAVDNYDISVEQFHILRNIRRGVTSVSELAKVKGISRSATSQAVELLVERGLICRLHNERDRRNIPLELTENGNHLLDAIWEKNRAWMRKRMAGMTPGELERLREALTCLSSVFIESHD